MTLVLGSGLLKRIEAPERYFSLRPEVCRVAEDIEKLLARLSIESRIVWQLLQNHDKARLLTGFVHEICHAVVERIEVLAEMHREQERLGNAVEDFLLGLGRRQVRVEEMLADFLRRLLQILHAISADRLNNVRTDGLQKHVAFLLKSPKKNCCDLRSIHDESKARVVIAGVKTCLGTGRLMPAAHNATRSAVPRARRLNRVLPVEATWLAGEHSFAIAEHDSVFRVGEGTADADQAIGGLCLFGQLGNCHAAHVLNCGPLGPRL